MFHAARDAYVFFSSVLEIGNDTPCRITSTEVSAYQYAGRLHSSILTLTAVDCACVEEAWFILKLDRSDGRSALLMHALKRLAWRKKRTTLPPTVRIDEDGKVKIDLRADNGCFNIGVVTKKEESNADGTVQLSHSPRLVNTRCSPPPGRGWERRDLIVRRPLALCALQEGFVSGGSELVTSEAKAVFRYDFGEMCDMQAECSLGKMSAAWIGRLFWSFDVSNFGDDFIGGSKRVRISQFANFAQNVVMVYAKNIGGVDGLCVTSGGSSIDIGCFHSSPEPEFEPWDHSSD
jgi:hypothetical protein